MQFVWYHWMVEWFGLISINGAHRKPWFSCSFLTLKPFSFWTKTIFSSSGNLPRREKGERRRGKKKKKKGCFYAEEEKPWAGEEWRSPCRLSQPIPCFSPSPFFSSSSSITPYPTLGGQFFFSLCMYVLTCVCISFLFFIFFGGFLWVCIYLVLLRMWI